MSSLLPNQIPKIQTEKNVVYPMQDVNIQNQTVLPFEPNKINDQRGDYLYRDKSFLGKDLYITQFDIDISWFTILGGKIIDNIPSTPFSISMEAAQEYGKKITKLAQEKGALISSLDPNKTSYPIIGHIIFTVRFLSEPKVNYVDKISRQDLINLLKNKTNDYDITSYIPNWTSDNRRYIFHPSAYPKLNLLNIKLIKTTSIDDHIAFCLFNTFSQSGKLKLQDIQLIKELMSNGDGKSFVIQITQTNLKDPFNDKYMEYKSKYLLNKYKIN